MRFLIVSLLLLLSVPAQAQQICSSVNRMNIDQPSTTADYVMDLDGAAGERTVQWDFGQRGYDIIYIEFVLTDANTSITSLVNTCTTGVSAFSIVAAPHVCDDTSDGTCVQTSGGIFTKASPASITVPYNIGISGKGALKCVWSVGAGTAGSSDDAIINYRVCTR